MKQRATKNIYRILGVAAIAAFAVGFSGLCTSCHREANELAHHHNHGDHDHGDHGHDGHDHGDHGHDDHDGHEAKAHTGGGPEIVISEAMAEKWGVTCQTVTEGTEPVLVKVTGQLLPSPESTATVSARSAGIVTLTKNAAVGASVGAGAALATISARNMAGGDPNEAARAALAAAKRELDRLTPLHADGIVSTRDYNAALQAYEQARVAASAASGSGSTATSPIAGTVATLDVADGAYVEAGQPIATVQGAAAPMLRVDLPLKNYADYSLAGGQIATTYLAEPVTFEQAGARQMSMASQPSTSGAYRPVYYSLNHACGLQPNTYCEVWLNTRGATTGLAVPRSALSEQQGRYFVYVRLDKECYEKRQVAISGSADAPRVAIASGLAAGEEVVTSGVTMVKLAETSGNVPQGHSHNH